jgi:nicotinamidase-related amidase
MTTERVWDRYLTEADRASLTGKADRRVGVGAKPALLMIDLYRGAFGNRPGEGDPGEWPGACGPTAWEALPHIQTLLTAARAAKLPVLHVTGLHESESGVPGFSEAAHRDYGSRGGSLTGAALDRYLHRYDVIPELAPIEGEVLLKKASPSVFWGTPLAAQLTYLGVDTVIVAGESTSGCVRASVVDGCTNRFRMQVVEECVFDRHEAPHAINLFDLHQKYADVIPLEQALDYIESASGSSRPRRETAASA